MTGRLDGRVTNMTQFLACGEARFVDGQVLNIDGGAAGKVQVDE